MHCSTPFLGRGGGVFKMVNCALKAFIGGAVSGCILGSPFDPQAYTWSWIRLQPGSNTHRSGPHASQSPNLPPHPPTSTPTGAATYLPKALDPRSTLPRHHAVKNAHAVFFVVCLHVFPTVLNPVCVARTLWCGWLIMGKRDSVLVFFSSSYLDFYCWIIMGGLFRLSNREN